MSVTQKFYITGMRKRANPKNTHCIHLVMTDDFGAREGFGSIGKRAPGQHTIRMSENLPKRRHKTDEQNHGS